MYVPENAVACLTRGWAVWLFLHDEYVKCGRFDFIKISINGILDSYTVSTLVLHLYAVCGSSFLVSYSSADPTMVTFLNWAKSPCLGQQNIQMIVVDMVKYLSGDRVDPSFPAHLLCSPTGSYSAQEDKLHLNLRLLWMIWGHSVEHWRCWFLPHAV